MFNTEDRRNMRQLGQLHESEENRYYQILRNKLSQLYDRDNLTAEQHQEIVELETDICKLIQVEAESDASGGGAQHPDKRRAGGHTVKNKDQLVKGNRDDYMPAIRHWETITRPAPPTVTGRSENQQVNPPFIEWAMGLPEGHVTNPAHKLTKQEQLTMLGNGVVPQQAAKALHVLLTT